ncbi:hypothetical protein QFZ75_008036 [Streptomyces sp. V3I8]|uniref:DUF7239 family protein n=1 Tax=Streptomyces sp. V3I8 TaxID=3042279 RepID=UPI00277F7C44|nr:hypothetical protein [Streptomyces sp. V3I8]MDQ1041534.1 hypothetical protein [Streptomyces sp. V3I8]
MTNPDPSAPPTGEEREPREDKLPDWVQRKLALLRQRLADERRTSAALRGGIEETDTFIGHYDIRPDQLLEPGSDITFVPDLARPNQTINCKIAEGRLIVHATNTLVIRPTYNNGLTLGLEK